MPNRRNIAGVGELETKFKKTRKVFLTDYRGLHVSELAALRRQLRELGVDYRVAKNTLTLIAAEKAGVKGLGPLLKGPTAIAFASGDEIATARVLSDFARTSRILTLKGGILGTHLLSGEDVAEIAKLPATKLLQADLVGSIQGPAAALVGVLNASLGGVVRALDERVKQLEEA